MNWVKGRFLSAALAFAMVSGITVQTEAATIAKKRGVRRSSSRPAKSNVARRVDYAVSLDEATEPLIDSEYADKKIYPASLTKMATLAVMFHEMKAGRIKPDDMLEITKEARRGASVSKSGLSGFISVDDAIKFAAVRSYNDVAYAIAQHIAGLDFYADKIKRAGLKPRTEKAFCDVIMQDYLKRIGMNNTRLYNSSGLPYKNTDRRTPTNVTTVEDLVVLMQHIADEYPQFMHYFGTQSITIPSNNMTLHNTNHLLQNAGGKKANPCDGVIGGKTGHTSASGFNLAVWWIDAQGKLNAFVSVGHRSWQGRDEHMRKMLEKFKTCSIKSASVMTYEDMCAPDFN